MANLFQGAYINEIERKSYPIGTPSKGYDANGKKISSQSSFLNANPVATVAPSAVQTTPQTIAQSTTRSKYINPATGKYFQTAEEYGNYVATKIPASKPAGDIPAYAGDAMTNPNQSVTDLQGTARNLNNARNDIAVGATDPYKVGNQSGIAYSPQELKAIENAYAGIYDPALNDVFARLKEKKATDEAALKKQEDIFAREWEKEKMALQHQYAMAEKQSSGLSGPSSYQEWALAGGKEGTGKTYAQYLSGESTNESFKSQIATTGKEAIATMLRIAEKNPGIFGRTAALPVPDSMRSDDFRNYKAQLETLKGNIVPAALTAMREAAKTGGALGQVSDREGAWLGASLGALEMSQSPGQIKEQLRQIDKHLTTWQDAVNAYSNTSSVSADERAFLKSQGVTDAEIDKLK
jgi:hypothetical protein